MEACKPSLYLIILCILVLPIDFFLRVSVCEILTSISYHVQQVQRKIVLKRKNAKDYVGNLS